MKGFVIPRGSVVLAGGEAASDATTFTLRAEGEMYGIRSNPYLHENSRAVDYEVTVSVDGDELTYEQTTTLIMKEFDEPYLHTDRNTLQRVTALTLPPAA